ncbi:MAG: TlpA disulfide reductase family protein [Pedobacter sp.]|nr:TlpA disulfide reductase family protein [Pedobacter sp.]
MPLQRPKTHFVPIMDAKEIAKDFNSFWLYFNTYALLHQDLQAVDEKDRPIDKGAFLQKISDGGYLPVVLQNEEGTKVFKLARLPKGSSDNIRLLLMNYANRELIYYRMEGKSAPAFDFTTISGKHFTSSNTKGKIVLFKCWFINCVACVEEMPALNKLVERYKDRNDILFISLAMDPKAPLKQFLTKTRFDYETVPDQTEYMTNKLHVQMYPTHYVINKKGILVKVPPDEAELEKYLAKAVGEKP